VSSWGKPLSHAWSACPSALVEQTGLPSALGLIAQKNVSQTWFSAMYEVSRGAPYESLADHSVSNGGARPSDR